MARRTHTDKTNFEREREILMKLGFLFRMKKMESKKEEITKGPWKAEEDEVLINHVKKYGPRDWSSIRSKGLLKRTGKSCRLRWVNKLRPNLKNGCKFSVDEERTVIELQSEFGNKWARIATYLPGRTDNDVKNFWSSRQKRLARILHNSSSNEASSSNSRNKIKSNNAKSARGGLNSSQVSGFGEEMIASSSLKILQCSSSVYLESSSHQTDETLTIPDLGIKLEHQPFNFCTDLVLPEASLFTGSQIGVEHQQAIVPFSPESRELLARLEDPFFYDILGATGDSCEPFSLPQPFFDPLRRCRQVPRNEPDVFLDDFPEDMFDQVDSVRSPVD